MPAGDRDNREGEAAPQRRASRGRRGTGPGRGGRRGGRGDPGARRQERTGRPSGENESAAVDASEPLVLVAFRGGRVEGFVNPKALVIRQGDFVLVEAERGMDLGFVIICGGPAPRRKRNQPPRALLRHATTDEIARLEVLAREDREALDICRGRVESFSLEMKVIDAETQFDSNRVTFYFTAERRVDFRELVRDLASIFRTRIELRQVGARDAARRCDGMGPCARQLCCTTFIREFEPVTLKMAKEQRLSLNPSKISGSCGRLMCCLNYECAAYRAAARVAPPVGSRWQYENQICQVSGLDLGNHQLFVSDAGGDRRAVDLDDFLAGATSAEEESRDPSLEAPDTAAERSKHT